MDVAAPALDLILRAERELLDAGYDRPHVGIVVAAMRRRKT
jgi:hypothetical protein